MRRSRHSKGDQKGRDTAPDHRSDQSRRWDRHAALAIFAAVSCAYSGVVTAGFTNWDDDRFIVNNPLFRGPIWPYVKAAFSQAQFQAYHPLHILSYLPDRLLWPDSPVGFHVLSVLLFAVALVLGYLLLRRTVSVLPALVAILLAGLSPLAVESVAWIVGRKDVLALLFMFAALLVEDGALSSPGSRPRRTAFAVALAVLACLSKTSAVILPIVLFAWLRFARELPWKDALRRCLPFGIVALLFAVPVPLIWRKNQMILASRPLPAVLDVLGTIGIYAGRVLVPVHLSPVYPSLANGQALAGLLAGASLLAVMAFWGRLPAAGKFAVVGFLGCLLPVSNLAPLYFRFADRYVLLALGALAWPLAKLLAWRKIRTVAVPVAFLALGMELWATMGQVSIWRDSLTLWQYAVHAQPRAVYGYLKLGETLRTEKHFRDAAAAYIRAGQIEPGSIKGPAGLLRTVGERAETDGTVPPGTCEAWESVIKKPGFDARRMAALIETLDQSQCRPCAQAMLWLGLRMFPQSDASLVSFAKKELDRGRKDTAMIYVTEIRDPNTEGLADLSKRLEAAPSQP